MKTDFSLREAIWFSARRLSIMRLIYVDDNTAQHAGEIFKALPKMKELITISINSFGL